LTSNGANGECGTGTCQSVQGTGLCTYKAAETVVREPEMLTLAPLANPTHYGDPKTGCESDEKQVQVQGVPGDFCSPQCKNGACPSDVPSGDTAKPQCALKTTTGQQYCALICTPSPLTSNGANGECGTGTCQSVQGTGLCTYTAAETVVRESEVLTLAPMANPTHYGDPKTGCESDEMKVQVQGVSGDFCSPQCTSAGTCPKDVPSGDTAKPECKLQTTGGKQYCALICTPSPLTSNGANGECGTGTCQSIQGVGLCTYKAAELKSDGMLLTLAATDNAVIV